MPFAPGAKPPASKTVAEAAARARMSINPHSGFANPTQTAPPQQPTGGLGGNPAARFSTPGEFGPPRGAGFGMGLGGNPAARFDELGGMPSYPGSDYNPYGPQRSMVDPTWAGGGQAMPDTGNGEDGGYLDDLISSWADGGMGYTDPFPGGMGMDPSWSPDASTKPGYTAPFDMADPSWSPDASTKPGYTAPFDMVDPTFGTPQSKPTMTNPMPGYTAPFDMVDPTFGAPQSKPTMTNPMLPDGGWPDQGDPGMMATDAEFMPDPRDEQQVFNHTNKLMEDARTEKEAKEVSRLAKVAAEEHAARYAGQSEEDTKRRAEYIERMNKLFDKQRIMMVLSAISGDPNIARMAQGMAEIEMKRMDMEYGEFKNDRLAKMQKSFFFDKDGNYDPPKTEAEAMEALNSMGATPAEMDAILGRMPESAKNSDYQNWFNTITGEHESSLKKPEGKGWIKSGVAEGYKPDAAGGSDTGAKGAQRNEIVALRNNVAQLTAQLGADHPQTLAAQEVLKLTEMLYGVTKDSGRSTTELNNIWRSIIDSNKDMLGRVDWDRVAESLDGDGGGDIENAVDFAEWFENYYVKSENNKLIDEGDPGSDKNNPIDVRTQEEFDSLEVGTWYVDGNRTPRQKEE